MKQEYWYRKNDNTSKGLVDLWHMMWFNTPRLMVEVGTADGGSACVWKSLSPDLQVIVVDPWIEGTGYGEDIFQAYLQNVEPFDAVAYLRMTSLEAAPLFPDASLDFVYIDAVHTYEAMSADLRAWAPKVKPGGWIGGHDYTPEFGGLMRAVNEFHKGHIYTFCDTSFLLRKCA